MASVGFLCLYSCGKPLKVFWTSLFPKAESSLGQINFYSPLFTLSSIRSIPDSLIGRCGTMCCSRGDVLL